MVDGVLIESTNIWVFYFLFPDALVHPVCTESNLFAFVCLKGWHVNVCYM